MAMVSSLERSASSTACTLLVLCFAAVPQYFFSSGGFQVIDPLVVLLSLYVLPTWDRGDIRCGVFLVGPFLPFLVWAVLVNAFYLVAAVSHWGFLLSAVQLLYGFYLFFLFALVFRKVLARPDAVRWLYIALAAACISPWLSAPHRRTIRNALSFNNPNQLAYFALLVLFMLHLFLHLRRLPGRCAEGGRVFFSDMTIFLAANVFVALSSSRAGFAAAVMLDGWVFYQLVRAGAGRILFAAAALPLVLMIPLALFYQGTYWAGEPAATHLIGSRLTDNTLKRFSRENLFEDLKGRTIGRIEGTSDLRIVFGNGGRKWRKNAVKPLRNMNEKEAHNIFFELLNSYGVVGLLLFLGGAGITASRIRIAPVHWIPLLALLVYNTAHNGFRFRFMWIALGLFAIVSLHAQVSPLADSKQSPEPWTGVKHGFSA